MDALAGGALVERVRGTWRIDPELLDEPFTARAALLSPLHRLVYDRERMEEIFVFDYPLEMYNTMRVEITAEVENLAHWLGLDLDTA